MTLPPVVVQFGRYVIVGGAAFVLDAGTLWLLTEKAGVHYLVAAAIGFCVGLLFNFALSIRWVFRQRSRLNLGSEFLVFGAVGIVGLGLNELFMWLFTDGLGLPYMGSKVVTAGLVLIWNFGARKALLYRGAGK